MNGTVESGKVTGGEMGKRSRRTQYTHGMSLHLQESTYEKLITYMKTNHIPRKGLSKVIDAACRKLIDVDDGFGGSVTESAKVTKSGSKLKLLIERIRNAGFTDEISYEALEKMVIEYCGSDSRTIEKYIGTWCRNLARLQGTPPDVQTYSRPKTIPGKRSKKWQEGLLMRLHFIEPIAYGDFYGVITSFRLNWEKVENLESATYNATTREVIQASSSPNLNTSDKVVSRSQAEREFDNYFKANPLVPKREGEESDEVE